DVDDVHRIGVEAEGEDRPDDDEEDAESKAHREASFRGAAGGGAEQVFVPTLGRCAAHRLLNSSGRRSRSTGNCSRNRPTSAGSISTESTSSPVPASARTRPRGSTTALCPPISWPAWVPAVLQPTTKHWFSTARARSSS